MPSNNGFGEFDILIAATDNKARGRRAGTDKINVRHYCDILSHTCIHLT